MTAWTLSLMMPYPVTKLAQKSSSMPLVLCLRETQGEKLSTTIINGSCNELEWNVRRRLVNIYTLVSLETECLLVFSI